MEIVIGCIVLIVTFAFVQLFWWVAFLTALALVLGIFEYLLDRKTGKTLSQRFWDFKSRNPVAGYIVLGVLTLAYAGLVVHLLWR